MDATKPITCEVKTPQFLGSQDKFYMQKFSGEYHPDTHKFCIDGDPNRVIAFNSFEQFEQYRVKNG